MRENSLCPKLNGSFSVLREFEQKIVKMGIMEV